MQSLPVLSTISSFQFPLPPPRPKNLGRNLLLRLLSHQINPLMPLHIHRQLLMLILILTWPLDQMHMHYTLSPRPFHIKPEPHMLRSPSIRLGRAANKAIARPARPRRLAERSDLIGRPKKCLTAGIGSNHGDGAVEVGGFGGGGEDVGEEEVANATCRKYAD